MSAIAGFFLRDGAPAEPEHLDPMLAAMCHRAPHGARRWCGGPVGLGHGALNATPESLHEKLPLCDGADGLAITGDLRIDNRRELIRTLDAGPRAGRDIGDGELVLQAYRRWGREVPKHLVGAFVFVVWDGRRQEIFCARDHLGAKPFVYHLTDRAFVFASEVEGVLAASGVPCGINEGRIADFLVSELEGIDHTSTFYLDVVKLPPAHTLVVGRESHRVERYWRPDPSYELRLASDEDYVEAFRDALRQAVGACLRSTTPAAVMLSGGIDSGAVAAFAKELLAESGGPRLRTLSALNDENRDCVESGCIRASIETLGTQAEIITPAYVRSLSPARRRSILGCSNPFDSTMTVPDLLYEKAQNSGVRVVLDGIDGDVVMSLGGTYIAHLLRRGRVLRAFREASARCDHRGEGASPWRTLVAGARSALAPAALRRLERWLRGRSTAIDAAIADSIINPDFACRIDLAERLERLHGLRWFSASGDARRDQGDNLLHPYATVGLERYDRVASRWGVDLRHPLLDLRLVELCLALPWHLKNRDGWTKYILRRATEEELPEEVRWRRGRTSALWGFTLAIMACDRSSAQTIIEQRAGQLGTYIDLGAVRTACEPLEERPSWQDELHLCEAFALALWLERAEI
jgi:asparagine synthase (glutamine-hydrolysing)